MRQQGEGCGTRDLWDQEKTWSRSEAEARPNPENLILRSAVGSLPHLRTLTSAPPPHPCRGPARPDGHSPVPLTLALPEEVT